MIRGCAVPVVGLFVVLLGVPLTQGGGSLRVTGKILDFQKPLKILVARFFKTKLFVCLL